jgi:hypothetical protein
MTRIDVTPARSRICTRLWPLVRDIDVADENAVLADRSFVRLASADLAVSQEHHDPVRGCSKAWLGHNASRTQTPFRRFHRCALYVSAYDPLCHLLLFVGGRRRGIPGEL